VSALTGSSEKPSTITTPAPHVWPELKAIATQSVSAGDRWPSLPAEVEAPDPAPADLIRERARWTRLEREQREW
jgi:hypothetical protein